MHELSIAGAIADVALRHAGGHRVTRVEVEIGHLRQVVPSALDFAFELVARESPLEGAELAVTDVPTRGRCRRCGHDGPLPEFPLACSACGALDVQVTAGGELLVTALEIEDGEGDDDQAPGRPSPTAPRAPPGSEERRGRAARRRDPEDPPAPRRPPAECNRRSPVWAGASTEPGTEPGGLRKDAAPSPRETFTPRR